MKSNLKFNEVKVRLADEHFAALKERAAELGLSHSGLLGMLLIEWVKRCVKSTHHAAEKEVTVSGVKRARTGVGRRVNFGDARIHLQV